MKKAAALTILFVFLLSSITAYAAEPRAVTVRPSLSFDGTTALCEVTVTSYGKSILVVHLFQSVKIVPLLRAKAIVLLSAALLTERQFQLRQVDSVSDSQIA